VPINQLQAESPTALAIGELLKADCCEVMVPGKGASPHRSVSLDESVHDVAREQVGTQGNRFLNINLDVRSTADSSAPTGDERRHSFTPQTHEVADKKPLLTGSMVDTAHRSEPPAKPAEAPKENKSVSVFGSGASSAPTVREPAPAKPPSEAKPFADLPAVGSDSKPDPVAPAVGRTSEPLVLDKKAAQPLVPDNGPAKEMPLGATLPIEASAEPIEKPSDEPSSEAAKADVEPAPAAAKDDAKAEEPAKPATSGKIVTIMAEKLKDEPKQQLPDRKEYVRKADWLRAQFLPEVESLDFSGLFVGNLGMGIREEKARRNVVLADPARITEVLLRANGYRRSGDHPKALICYQELVDMDASNSDFRFLLGKTLIELGQREQAVDAFTRAKELGHDGAARELDDLKRSGHRPKAALGFLRFWKQ